MKKLLIVLIGIVFALGANAQFTCYPDMDTFSMTCYGAVSNDTTSFQLDTVTQYEYQNKRGFKNLRSSYKRPVTGSRIVFADKNGYIDAAPVDSLKKMLFTGTTSQYVRGDGSLATFSSGSTPTPSNPTMNLNTAYQPSATRPTLILWTVQVANTLSFAATASFQISSNGTTYTEVTKVNNTLAIATTYTNQMSYVVPAGYYYKIVTTTSGIGSSVTTSGTPQQTIF